MTLPSPLFLSTLGAGLVVTAGLAMWFLHTIELSAIVGGCGTAILLVAAAAVGYEHLGEAKLQPKLDAATSLAADEKAMLDKQTAYADQLNKVWSGAHDASEFRGKQIEELENANEKLERDAAAKLPADVAAQRIDGRAVCLLDGTCPTSADTRAKGQADSAGLASGGSGGSSADTSPSVGDAALAAVVDWGITCKNRYAKLRKQVVGWGSYFDSLWTEESP
jgi:hypothetical protein